MSSLFVWPPPKRRIKLCVVIPISLLSTEQTLYDKTVLLGYLARALAVFRVDEVAVYVDEGCYSHDIDIVKHIFNYMLTPPYLRRRIIGRMDILRYTGILPPLNVFTHPETREEIRSGVVREGVILRIRGKYAKIYIGLSEDLIAEVPTTLRDSLSEGSRVYVRITKARPLRGIIVTDDELPWYAGFKLAVIDSVVALTKYLGRDDELCIVTTKYGCNAGELVNAIVQKREFVKAVKILFGNPRLDFDELLGPNLDLIRDFIRFKVNTIPLQGTRSVRTVEAIYASLAVINQLMYHAGIT